MVSVWEKHPELVDKLKVLHDQGHSNSAVARALGHGITRNAVIGKLMRIGAQPRNGSGASQAKRRPKAFVLPPVTDAHRRKAADKPGPTVLKPLDGPPEPMRDEHGKLITVQNVKDSHCRYVYGDVRTGDFHYCGHKKKRGPFCDFHAPNCFQQPLSRTNSA